MPFILVPQNNLSKLKPKLQLPSASLNDFLNLKNSTLKSKVTLILE